MCYNEHIIFFKGGKFMATKKVGSTAKKTPKKSPASKPSTVTTKVSTISAVDTKPALVSASTSRRQGSRAPVIAALIGEFIGTFVLTAAYIITKGEPLYLGFTLIAVVLLVATLSGAHVNPLLTVGAWVTRKITSLRALGYIVAQVFGAIAAVGILTAFVGGAPQQDAGSQAAMLGQQSPELFKVEAMTAGKEAYVFFAELLGATIFAFAVATAIRESRDRVARAFGIGFGLFAAALIAGVAASYVSTHVVLNPAIAFTVGAIDITKFNILALAAYAGAPLLGGMLGFLMSDVLYGARSKDEE